MTNRKRIEKFCRDRGLKIQSLDFYRRSTYVFGDPADCSYWVLWVQFPTAEIVSFYSDKGDAISSSIDIMLGEIDELINEPEPEQEKNPFVPFARRLSDSQIDLDPESNEIVNEYFWELL